MFETYRMLGAEREAELLHEAQRLQALPPAQLWIRLSRVVSVVRRPAPAANAERARAAEPEPGPVFE